VDLFRSHRKALVLVSVAMAAFLGLATTAIVNEGSLLRFDVAVEQALMSVRTGWLNTAMVWLTFLGTRYAIGAATLGLVVWSLVNKRHRTFVMVLAVAVLLNPLFEVGFKELVDRVRPSLDQLVPGYGPSFPSGHVLASVGGYGPSFPSGHVLASVGFYGLVPFLTWEMTRNAWARLLAVIGSFLVIVAVTISRPYLDVHWATDATAGVLLGTVLVVGTYHAFLRFQRAAQRVR
jgi:undecaprenyl-diphosphatase